MSRTKNKKYAVSKAHRYITKTAVKSLTDRPGTRDITEDHIAQSSIPQAVFNNHTIQSTCSIPLSEHTEQKTSRLFRVSCDEENLATFQKITTHDISNQRS